MRYECSRGGAPGGNEKKRRQISILAAAWLNCHLPASALTLIGRLTGNRAQSRLVRDLVEFISNPVANYNRAAYQWALSYADPGIVRKLIRSVSKVKNDDWWHGMLNQADPDLLLPREHTTPDYQAMWTSSASPGTTLVCFTGNALRLNMPVQLFHCVAAHRFDQLIYLRDPKKQYFSFGLEGMGATMDDLVASLGRRIPANCEVSVIGTSGGGIAATRFADSVGAKRLALFSPVFKFNETCAADPGGLGNVGAMKIFLARHNNMDKKLYSQWQPISTEGAIEMLDTGSHGTLSYLAATEQLDSLLNWLAGRSDLPPSWESAKRVPADSGAELPDLQQTATM